MNNLFVYCEIEEGNVADVSLELLTKGRSLANQLNCQLEAVVAGSGLKDIEKQILPYGVDKLHVFDGEGLYPYTSLPHTAILVNLFKEEQPQICLMGATVIGRDLGPRVSSALTSGLTADCTSLEIGDHEDKKEGKTYKNLLYQIRPAFGGNIMAQIVTTNTRPQFATVRYKVMNAPARQQKETGEVKTRPLPKGALRSSVTLVGSQPVPAGKTISDAEILVVGGRGLQKESDLEMIRELAALLGGDWAVSRPLVEKGWTTNARQIGLSGRTVRPRLMITCGVSGAIQFSACMNASEHIVAINSDANAPIFEVAHVGIVGDLYQIVPDLIGRLKEGLG